MEDPERQAADLSEYQQRWANLLLLGDDVRSDIEQVLTEQDDDVLTVRLHGDPDTLGRIYDQPSKLVDLLIAREEDEDDEDDG